MIKVYKLKIAEKVYEVELEDVSEKSGKISSTKAVETAPVAIATAPATNAEGKSVEAPMQGVILSVSVSVGDTVNEGDELLILEAMKMENPILAPFSGKVTEINVAKGDNVNDGTILLKIS